MPGATCIYDGDCGFCRQSVLFARGLVGSKVDFQPSQEVASQYPEIAPEAFERSVQFVDEEGHVSEGAEAVFRCLSRGGGLGWLLTLYLRIGPFRSLMELGYRMVARHRSLVSTASRWLVGPTLQVHSLVRVRWLLLRLMGLVYILAFASLLPQLPGLIGSEGILPFDQLLEQARPEGSGSPHHRLDNLRTWLQMPTLLWLAPTDQGLMALCWLGLGSGFLLLTNRWVRLASLLCWLSYLSIYAVAQNFLWLQWDLLLLESGFLTLLLAGGVRGRGLAAPSPPRWITIFLFRCLAFRLLFSSGLVKLLSGDPTWANNNALLSHFETQPLPNLGAWWAHQLPDTLLIWGTGLTLALEVAVPLFFFAPRRLRATAALLSIGLMALIFATGNYGFFNLLTIVLLVALFDDDHLLWLGRRLRRHPEPKPETDPRKVPLTGRPPFAPAAWVLGLFFAYTGLAHMGAGLGWRNLLTSPGETIAKGLQPLSIVGRYGLFATMTDGRAPEAESVCDGLELGASCQFDVLGRSHQGRCGQRHRQRRCEPVGGRLELRIEGSMDGQTWQAYELPYKPGELGRPPGQVAPHMPRLDWLMWFAALRPAHQPPGWFQHLMLALLEARAPVRELFATVPFGQSRPRYLRVQADEYRFDEGETGRYWQRRPRGLWMGPVQLEAPR